MNFVEFLVLISTSQFLIGSDCCKYEIFGLFPTLCWDLMRFPASFGQFRCKALTVWSQDKKNDSLMNSGIHLWNFGAAVSQPTGVIAVS